MSPVVWKGTEKSTINHELPQYPSAGGEKRGGDGGGGWKDEHRAKSLKPHVVFKYERSKVSTAIPLCWDPEEMFVQLVFREFC